MPNSTVNTSDNSHLGDNNPILIISENVAQCIEIEVQTTVPCSKNINSTCDNQNCSQYEQYIRQTPSFFCACCERFLFNNQIHYISNRINNEVITALNINGSSALCKTCHTSVSKNKVPAISLKLNKLSVDTPSFDFQKLSSIEKKNCLPNSNFL